MTEAIRTMPLEMVEWVIKLVVMLNNPNETPKGITWYLACLAPENPNNCTCDPDHLKRYEDDRWMHANHVLWNDILWTAVNAHPGLLQKLRQVVKRDIDLAAKDSKATIWVEGYHNSLLEGFFTSRPTWNQLQQLAA